MLTNITQYKANFPREEVPVELIKLLDFQNEKDAGYSDGFWLRSNDKMGLMSWSHDDGFLDCLVPFARANASGSFYALWKHGKTDNLSMVPIVLFGDEGGEFVVAENLATLLQVLTFDVEPMIDIDEGVSFYKGKEYRPSKALESYKLWLKKNVGLDPTENPAKLVQEAQEKFQTKFDAWKKQYIQA